MAYQQTLYKIIEPIKKTTISRLNKGKKWKYGYNEEHDVVVISKTGKIGEIYEIQNLRIALPAEKDVDKENDKWVAHDCGVKTHAFKDKRQDRARECPANDDQDQRQRDHPNAVEIRCDPERDHHAKER